MASGVPTGPRGGTHRAHGSNIPTPLYGTIDTASRTLEHTYALNVRFLNQLYSRQLTVSCILMLADWLGLSWAPTFTTKVQA